MKPTNNFIIMELVVVDPTSQYFSKIEGNHKLQYQEKFLFMTQNLLGMLIKKSCTSCLKLLFFWPTQYPPTNGRHLWMFPDAKEEQVVFFVASPWSKNIF